MTGGRTALAGARLWVASGVLVLAIIAGLASLGTVLQPGPWLSRGLIVVVLVAACTTTLRHVLRSRTAPTAWGAGLALVVVAGGYGGPTTGWSVPSPTLETLERLRLLLDGGVLTINESAVPVETTRGLDLLVVLGAIACYLVADLLVLAMSRAGLAGIPVVALWTPAALFQKQPALLLVALGVSSYLILLGLTHRRPPRVSPRGPTTVAAAAAGLTVLTLVMATVAAALPFYGSQRLPAALGGGPSGISSPLRLSTDLDMRVSLSQRSDEPLLTYVTDGTPPGPLRTHTLTEFDGQRWHRSVSVSGAEPPTGLLWPEDDVFFGDADPAELTVETHGLDQDRLPITIDPRRIDVAGTWTYDPRFDEVMAVGGTSTRDLTYRLTFTPRELTADSLREDRAGTPPILAARFQQVPATEHEADIRALADEITGEEDTDYDRALALQMYLRSATNFTYDTQIPPAESPDAVWEFLERRSGYCVQFATTMVVMARMLGIPARVAVGFLPGEAVPDTPRTFEVTGRKAHAWPELYFADAGWVRFEPTPALQTGAPPLWADPYAGLPLPEPDIPESMDVEQPVPTTAPAPSSGGSGYISIGDAEVPVAAAVGILTVLLVTGAAWVLLRRRHHHERRPAGPDEWWARLRSLSASHGVVWSDATTPRQAARALRDAYPPGTADPDAEAALRSLVRAVENVRYAPVPTDWSVDDLEAWVQAAHRPLVEEPIDDPVGATPGRQT